MPAIVTNNLSFQWDPEDVCSLYKRYLQMEIKYREQEMHYQAVKPVKVEKLIELLSAQHNYIIAQLKFSKLVFYCCRVISTKLTK